MAIVDCGTSLEELCRLGMGSDLQDAHPAVAHTKEGDVSS